MKAEQPRIASLLASATEIVCRLGLADRLVAISHECDYPPAVMDRPRVTLARLNANQQSSDIDAEVRRLARVGESLYEIDIDRLASLHPEVIITQAHCDVCAVSNRDVLQAISQRTELSDAMVVALNPRSLTSVYDDFLHIGDACGESELAKQLVESMRRRVDCVANRTQSLHHHEKPRTVCIEWIDPVMVAANWMPELLELAGGRCSLAQAGGRSGYTDWQDIVEFDPEVIVVMPCGFPLKRALAEAGVLWEKPGWAALSACKTANVFAVDGNAYFNRSGPRLIDSLELLASLLHPTLFPEHESLTSECSARLIEVTR